VAGSAAVAVADSEAAAGANRLLGAPMSATREPTPSGMDR